MARMSLRSTLTILFVMACMTPAMPQVNTPAQRAACEGDVMRLCLWYVPRRARIIKCMQAKHDQLSPKCARVFDAGMATLGR